LSTFVNDSKKVSRGTNIDSSSNLHDSLCVVNSKNVFESRDVFNSTEIVRSSNVTDSSFCTDCNNIKNCLFCCGLSDKEYCIFNQPIDKNRYDFILKQYQKRWTEELNFVSNWPEQLMQSYFLDLNTECAQWYVNVPKSFWRWVRTLTGFDSLLMYEMTMLPEILVD
jgi:hypothetical protein